MLPLASNYTKNSYNFALVNRTKDVAIYSQALPETGKIIGYEVFEVLKKPAFSLNGYDYPAQEQTPSNNQWGQLGFTVSDLEAATIKQGFLLNKIEVRSIQNS